MRPPAVLSANFRDDAARSSAASLLEVDDRSIETFRALHRPGAPDPVKSGPVSAAAVAGAVPCDRHWQRVGRRGHGFGTREVRWTGARQCSELCEAVDLPHGRFRRRLCVHRRRREMSPIGRAGSIGCISEDQRVGGDGICRWTSNARGPRQSPGVGTHSSSRAHDRSCRHAYPMMARSPMRQSSGRALCRAGSNGFFIPASPIGLGRTDRGAVRRYPVTQFAPSARPRRNGPPLARAPQPRSVSPKCR